MKVLFVTSRSPDHLSSVLWDGIQEVLGEDNVVDAVGCPLLHRSEAEKAFPGKPELHAISATREGRTLRDTSDSFDLMVINAVFNRDFDWNTILTLLDRMALYGKIAYVEGWDAAWQIHPPIIPADAVFRKEIHPGWQSSYTANYHVPVHHLTFAAPTRWFSEQTEGFERPVDIFFSGSPDTNHPDRPWRWPSFAGVFQSKKIHHSIVASTHLGVDRYFSIMRQSKLALCPAAADGADSLRTYEAAVCGAIPFFIGYPPHVRDNWFTPEMSFSCATPAEVPGHVDEALHPARDLGAMRKLLLEHTRKYHTTAARARKLLEVVG